MCWPACTLTGVDHVRSTSKIGVSLAMFTVLIVGAAGCASNDTASQATSPAAAASPSGSTSSPPTSSSPAGQLIEVQVENGRVSPSPDRRVEVPKGQTVQIRVTSDHEDEIHVHGYDIEKPINAGQTITIEFVADLTGSFEVEMHEIDPGLLFTLFVE